MASIAHGEGFVAHLTSPRSGGAFFPAATSVDEEASRFGSAVAASAEKV
jgi:hypothetical protein